MKNLRLRQDLPISINEKVILPFPEDFIFTKLRENKVHEKYRIYSIWEQKGKSVICFFWLLSGYFCVTGTSVPAPCPLGTYGNSTGLRASTDCTPCPGGYYCDGLGLTTPRDVCDAGFYCREKAYSSAPPEGLTGGVCPQGFYCPAGSAIPQACNPGQYVSISGAKNIYDCVDCLPGFFCAGASNANATQECSPGFYCIGGASVPTQNETEPGYYTESGAFKMQPCPAGNYQPASKSSACEPCPNGFYCNATATIDPHICPVGNYCPESSTFPTTCPEGTYNPNEGQDSFEICVSCDAGKACEMAGLELPNTDCDPGHYCTNASQTRIHVGEVYGDLCPPGYYCPLGTKLYTDFPCPNGTYSNFTGLTAEENCTLCDPGMACNGLGLTAPNEICAAGFFCRLGAYVNQPQDAGATGDPCPIGNYCPAGSSKFSILFIPCSSYWAHMLLQGSSRNTV